MTERVSVRYHPGWGWCVYLEHVVCSFPVRTEAEAEAMAAELRRAEQ